MKDGNVYDFLDHAAYEEVAVEYNGYKYFFYGLRQDEVTGLYTFVVDRYTMNNPEGTFAGTVYDKAAPTKAECMEQFFQTPLIDGKTFWELEKDMTWIEW